MGRPRPPIALAYHGVADVPLAADPHCLFTAPRALLRHIRALRRWGYELVSFGELARRAACGESAGLAALTFDDGLADNLHALAPLLEAERAPATVFAVSGWLGSGHPDAPDHAVLSGPQLRALRAAGIEIGAHTCTHPDLTRLGYAEALGELRGSRLALEEVLDEPVRIAAYPYGAAGPETERACRAAGFVAACRVEGTGSWDDPFALPRQSMGNASTMAGLRLKRAGRFEQAVRRRPWGPARMRRRRALTAVQRFRGAARGGPRR